MKGKDAVVFSLIHLFCLPPARLRSAATFKVHKQFILHWSGGYGKGSNKGVKVRKMPQESGEQCQLSIFSDNGGGRFTRGGLGV